LTWVLRHDEVTSALIGASKVSQIEDAASAIESPRLTEDELKTIDGILAGS